MTASPVYSPIRRTRATKAEVEARREALLDIIEAGRPGAGMALFERKQQFSELASRDLLASGGAA